MAKKKAKKEELNIDMVAKKIGVSIENWKGNCYSIACKIITFPELEIFEGRAIYGHYLGSVHPQGFFGKRAGMPFIHHGWIETGIGVIVDPTRWVFENVKPYITIFDPYDPEYKDYDEGGSILRAMMTTPPPDPKMKVKGPFGKIVPVRLSDDAKEYISSLLDCKIEDEIAVHQLFWLANLTTDMLGIYCKEILEWIVNLGKGAFIPIDHRIQILGEKLG